MKVGELITELQKLDPELHVGVSREPSGRRRMVVQTILGVQELEGISQSLVAKGIWEEGPYKSVIIWI